MALTIEQRITASEVLTDFHTEHKIIDAMTVAREFNRRTGQHVDWHEFSYYLDEMYCSKKLIISKPGGFVQYKLNFTRE